MAIYLLAIMIFVVLVAVGLLAHYYYQFRTLPRPTLPSCELPPFHFLEISDSKICYVSAGRGPPLLLLHGIGASIYTWRFLIAELSMLYQVTAIDLPGFGKSSKNGRLDYGLQSQARRVCEILDRLEIKRCFLAGSSMGGAIALWMTYQHPDRFPLVAGLAPAAHPGLVPLGVHYLTPLAPVLTPTIRPKVISLIMSRVMAKRELINEESIQTYSEPYRNNREAIKVFIRATKVISDPQLFAILPKIENKILILWGKNDRMVPYRYLTKVVSKLPNVTLEEHAEAGHHTMEDDPGWTAAQLHQFFSTHKLD